MHNTVKALYFEVLYFPVFPMNVSSLELNFTDFGLLYWYNSLPKCFRGIFNFTEINPMQHLRLLRYSSVIILS